MMELVARESLSPFLSALHDSQPVRGLTHDFYRYPARFSPEFARAVIESFSEPGDVVLDPFVGGGTTLVEARVAGRLGVGADRSSLAVFAARAKTTVLSGRDRERLRRWAQRLTPKLNTRTPIPATPNLEGSPRNLDSTSTWRLRKLVAIAVNDAARLPATRVERFARCAILRTGQWALDGRDTIPTVDQFRSRFREIVDEMLQGAEEFERRARDADRLAAGVGVRRTVCLKADAGKLAGYACFGKRPPPKLVLTSPPYPGIHVLYNRWQIMGRRETAAAFWIAGGEDDNEPSELTFGDRRSHHDSSRYYSDLEGAFRSVGGLLDRESLVVQLVAFSQPGVQLPRFLSAMERAGYREVHLSARNGRANRQRREVPNRKWYANQWGLNGTRREVLLFHQLA